MTTPKTLILTCLALAIVGCGGTFDPCSQTSPLWNGLTPDQQANCIACNDPSMSECDSTTGDVVGEELTCATGSEYIQSGVYCAVGVWPAAAMGEPPGEIDVIDASACRTLSTNTFPCYQTWAGGHSGGPSECVLCDAINGEELAGGGQAWGSLGPYTPQHVKFGLCSAGEYIPGMGDMYYGSGYVPSDFNAGIDAMIAEAIVADWSQPLGCPGDPVWFPNGAPFACDVVQIRDPNWPVAWDNEVGMNWTCSCESDADCQPGAVCEAGWVFDNGFPHPTLCTPDAQALPAGPVVYGMHDWSDGIDITVTETRGSRQLAVIVTPQALVGAITNAGLWNDNQRFTINPDGMSATIDECGQEALCSALGLAAGDVVYLDSIALDDAYVEAAATVAHADGRVSSIEVMTE